MAIHAIVWDIGGVLLRTADLGPRVELAVRLGLDPQALDHLVFGIDDNARVQLGEISYDQHWANISRRLAMNPGETAEMRQSFFAHDVLDLDLIERIRAYKAQGYCTAVLSNYWETLRGRIRDEWQIDDAFHHLVISSEVGLMKPDPAIFQLLLETIGYAPEETLFIDDAAENIAGAHDTGMHTIHFTDKTDALAQLEKQLTRTPT
jgi:epoxide hydrolase-like predicted phosphatase